MVDDTFSGVRITLMSQSVLFSGRQPVTRIVPDGKTKKEDFFEFVRWIGKSKLSSVLTISVKDDASFGLPIFVFHPLPSHRKN